MTETELDLWLTRLEWATAIITDLEGRLPVLRRDLHAMIAEIEMVTRPPAPSEPSQDRADRHVQAVEAVLRRRFGGALELSEGYWRSTAADVIAAAEVGI